MRDRSLHHIYFIQYGSSKQYFFLFFLFEIISIVNRGELRPYDFLAMVRQDKICNSYKKSTPPTIYSTNRKEREKKIIIEGCALSHRQRYILCFIEISVFTALGFFSFLTISYLCNTVISRLCINNIPGIQKKCCS